MGSIIAAFRSQYAFMGMGNCRRLLVLLLYVAVNTGIGSIIEPRPDGQRSLGNITPGGAGALLIWGYVFGPIGMVAWRCR